MNDDTDRWDPGSGATRGTELRAQRGILADLLHDVEAAQSSLSASLEFGEWRSDAQRAFAGKLEELRRKVARTARTIDDAIVAFDGSIARLTTS
ncbi:hypothetical protein [Luethyella okanaganae]|uniref:WXG100 family type VII secretion target n=1 Tax=Luethyella okanaganae TaxID=69372 RepID=A0ABW1VE81_9MICO